MSHHHPYISRKEFGCWNNTELVNHSTQRNMNTFLHINFGGVEDSSTVFFDMTKKAKWKQRWACKSWFYLNKLLYSFLNVHNLNLKNRFFIIIFERQDKGALACFRNEVPKRGWKNFQLLLIMIIQIMSIKSMKSHIWKICFPPYSKPQI